MPGQIGVTFTLALEGFQGRPTVEVHVQALTQFAEALDWLEPRRYERGSSYMYLYQNAHCGPAKGFYNFGRIHASPKWGGERTWG